MPNMFRIIVAGLAIALIFTTTIQTTTSEPSLKQFRV